jgi:3-dehydroquinate synthase
VSELVVHVDVPEQSYDVVVGTGLLELAGHRLREVSTARRVALITDSEVASLFGVRVSVALTGAGFDVVDISVPAGESSKSWPVAGSLLEELAKAGLGRTDLVVALGGGVVGDLAGFVAATYMRGIAFAQLPTTLLAMVDSSVGGKTGVDLQAGKNLAGAFKQPRLVLADTSTLTSLPGGEWRSGLAEVAKSAVIDGEEFLGWLEEHADDLTSREPSMVAEAVRRCVRFKSHVVSRDEKEEGPRECLNYGHTLGHAIEKVTGYGTVPHGAAVAEGMRFAARVAMATGAADADFVKRQDRLLSRLGLEPLDLRLQPALLLEAMRGDKKAREGAIRMVLPDAPGVWHCGPVDAAVIRAHLTAWSSTKEGER